MSEIPLERKAYQDLLKRHKAIISKLTNNPLIHDIVENTIHLDEDSRTLIAYKIYIAPKDEEVDLILALNLALFNQPIDKEEMVRLSLEKPYPKYEPTAGLTTLKFPPDFESHVKEKARKG